MLFRSILYFNAIYVSNATNPRNPYARHLSQPSLTQENNKRNQLIIFPTHSFFDNLRTILEKTLVTSVDNYINQINANKAASKLEAFSTEILYEKATADTSEQMDLRQSVSPQVLEELIAKSTKKAVSDLSREIQSLKAKLTNQNKNSQHRKISNQDNSSTKNSQMRGREGASIKKKSNNCSTSQFSSPHTQRRNRSHPTKPSRKKQDDKIKIPQPMPEKIILATKETRTTEVALPPTTTRGENKSH